MEKIRNTDASHSLKVTEIIHKETTLAPGQELQPDPDTKEVNVEVTA